MSLWPNIALMRPDRDPAHRRAAAIDEASRALVSDTVSVLMLPARPDRRLQVAFQHSEPALLSIAAARTLHRQLGNLLAIADGRPIEP